MANRSQRINEVGKRIENRLTNLVREMALLLILTVIVSSLSALILPEQPAGQGTALAPYEIETIENLYWITVNASRWSYHYKQTADIDLNISPINTGEGWLPIGNESQSFTGVYDGQGYDILNLFINRPNENYVGLFGRIEGDSEQQAKVKNIYITGVDVTGNNYVGSLLGGIANNRYVEIYNCSAESKITRSIVRGTSFTGGLVGAHKGEGPNRRAKMFFPFADVDVYYTGTGPGNVNIGGLVGSCNRAEIYNSFSLGNVYGDNANVAPESYADYVGGLAGTISHSLVERCFSYGTVTASGDNVGALAGNVQAEGLGGAVLSYYNSTTNEVEGQGIPLPADGFADPSNFEGWDFIDEWQISPEGFPEFRSNPISNTTTEGLPFFEIIDNNSLYSDSNLGGKAVYASFLAGDNSSSHVIFAAYSTNPSALNGFSNSENLGGYFKFFTFTSFNALRIVGRTEVDYSQGENIYY